MTLQRWDDWTRLSLAEESKIQRFPFATYGRSVAGKVASSCEFSVFHKFLGEQEQDRNMLVRPS